MSNIKKAPQVEQETKEQEGHVRVGQWYWIEDHEEGAVLTCVTDVGSNYVELTWVGKDLHTSVRIHYDHFADECIPEPNATAVIEEHVEKYKLAARHYLREVRRLTAKLGVELPALGNEITPPQ